MSFWNYRDELSREKKMRRTYYELLRDDIDQLMVTYSLIDSFYNFKLKDIPYPFVERRELKPRARVAGTEFEDINSFLVMFVEGHVPSENKKYIRFFDVNKTTKTNLTSSEILTTTDNFDRTHKYLDSIHFTNFMQDLLPVDYALLIQRDFSINTKNRYALSHYHVRIDWPIADASEELAKELRYIVKDLYEKGDKYAEDIQKKFFEYYGLPIMAGGRRTAAIVAAQYLTRLPCISTVYVSSSESRTLMRFSERGHSKAVLMRLSLYEMLEIAEENEMNLDEFTKGYLLDYEEKDGIFIFQASYERTAQALPPKDGKLRGIKSDQAWLRVCSQYIMPKTGEFHLGLIVQSPQISENLPRS